MRKLVFIFSILFYYQFAVAQIPVYKWVSGDTLINQPSTIINTEIGPRQNAASWQDANGDFWLYGGEGYDKDEKLGIFNDLWHYSLETKKWSWIQGNDLVDQKSSRLDNALHFDGIDDQIEIDTLKEYAQGFTWEAWIKTANDTGGIIQFGPGQNSGFCCGSNATIDLTVLSGRIFVFNDIAGNSFSSAAVNDDEWHHIALTMEQNEIGNDEVLTVYIDGIVDGTISGDFDELIDESDTSYHVTKIGYSQYGFFEGSMDEVRIWSVPKSQEDIVLNMNAILNGDETSLMAYYDFNQGIREGSNSTTMSGSSSFTPVIFTKADFADPTLEPNQDRITQNVWLTRSDDSFGLYNIAEEIGYDQNSSPLGTLWAMGNTEDLSDADYGLFYNAVGGWPPNVIGQEMSLFLPNEERYFDVSITQWTDDNTPGGGFSYTRTEVGGRETPSYDTLQDLTLNKFHGTLMNFTNRGESSFKGNIAEVSSWSKALSHEEIISNMYGLVGNEPNLEAYYNFSEGNPNGDNSGILNLVDQSSNGSNGNLIDLNLTGNFSNYSNGELPALLTYLPKGSTSTGNQARDLVSQDFNGDGDLDLAIVNADDNTVSILMGDGTGAMGPASNIAVGNYPVNIITSKLNADAFWDLAIANQNSAEVSILLGDGAGGFSAAPTVTGLNGAKSVIAGLFDADGFLDLAIANNNTDVTILLGDGAGNYGPPASFDIGLGNSADSYELVTGDFNGDSNLDIATANTSNNDVSLILGDGAGSFGVPTKFSVGSEPRALVAGFFNADANLDLAVANLTGSSVSILLGDGAGSFAANVEYNSNTNSEGINAADYNNDGNIDLAVSNSWNTSIGILLGDGSGGFDSLISVNSWDEVVLNIHTDDFDNDGTLDIAICHPTQGVNVILGNVPNFAGGTQSTNTLNFDGLGDFVEIDGLEIYHQNFTWQAWVNTEEDGTIFSYAPDGYDTFWDEGGITLFIDNGTLNVDVWGVGGPYGKSFDINNGYWHHITVTVEVDYNGANERVVIYVDGSVASDEADWDFDQVINADPGVGFVTKIGYTNNNFPPATVTSGGLEPGSNSNWLSGLFPESNRSRSRAVVLKDSQDNFWLFGGYGRDINGWEGYLSDLIKYDSASNTWLNVSGTETKDTLGVYGTKGVAHIDNFPGARNYSNGWVDSNNDFWIFGGFGIDKRDSVGQLNDLWKYDMVSGEWAWIAGADITKVDGTYGTKGTGDINNIPGARDGHTTWTDENGIFWLFGGAGSIGVYNDLWQYNSQNGEWTWVSGANGVDQAGEYGILEVADAANIPGARTGSITWIDNNGVVWLFGGNGRDKNGLVVEALSDLWKYEPLTNLWTWMGGPDFSNNTGDYGIFGVASIDNIPGARQSANSFYGSDENLWLFGGYKETQGKAGTYNDLWRYKPSTKEWTWLGGLGETANTTDNGTYGTASQGSRQTPGGRDGAVTWTDKDGNLWMYSGNDNKSSTDGVLNDLWKYEPENDFWIYKGGSVVSDTTSGDYGTKGVGSSSNSPRSRWHASSWLGPNDKLWFFGGITPDGTGDNIAWLNDFWSYDTESEVYTWMGGSNTHGDNGLYGVKGVPSVNKIPGARSSAASWVDRDGMMWIFGGYESFEYYNDLWKHNPFSGEWTWVSGRNSQNIPGSYGTKGVPDANNEIGSRRYMSTWVDKEGDFWVFGGQGRDSRSEQGYLNDLWRYNPNTDEWTWMHGSDTTRTVGVYGVKGVAAPENTPPPRYTYSSWTDDSGNFWLFGGINTDYGWYDDLWKYDPRVGMWTWVGGSEDYYDYNPNVPESTYGTIGVGSTSNMIGARERAAEFQGKDKKFWLFGGRNNSSRQYSELWEITFIPGVPFIDNTNNILQDGFTIVYDEAWATSFQLQISDDPTFTSVIQDFNTTNNDSTKIAGLTSGSVYYYRVKGVNEQGQSNYSASVEVLTLPDSPQFSTISISELKQTSAIVNWEQVTGLLDNYSLDISLDSTFIDISSYLIGYQSKSIVNNILLDSVETLLPGTKYFVRMKANNATGSSLYTQTLELLTPPATPDFTGIASPVIVNQTSAQITWNEVPEIIEGYNIEVATDELFTDLLTGFDPAQINKSQHQIEIPELTAGTLCYVRISAYNASGLSVPSSTLQVLTLPESPIFSGDSFVTSVTQTSAVVNWSSIPEIFDGYHLEVSIDPDFSNNAFFLGGYGKDNIPKNIDKTLDYDTIKNLNPGSSFYARVRSYNSSGDSPNSNVVRVETVPRAPKFNEIKNITQTSASLGWLVPQGTTSFLFDLNTSDVFDSSSSVISDLPLAVPFEILGDLIPGTTYYSRIQSTNQSGASGSMTPADYGDTLFITIPETPFIETPSAIFQTGASLQWLELKGAEGYYIDVSDNGFQTFLTDYNGIQLATNSVDVSGLNSGENFQIRLRSFNVSGESPYSTTLSVLTIPATPTARDATTVSANSFTANWDPVSGATYYVLEVSDDDFATFIHEQTYTLTNPIQITNLLEGTTYKFRVRSGNASGDSPNSNVVSVIATNNAQSLAISSVEFESEMSGSTSSVPVIVNLTGGQGTVEAWFRHKPILSSTWSENIEIVKNSDEDYEFVVNEIMLDDVGVEFEVYVSDGVSNPESLGNFIYRSFDDASSEQIPLAVFGGGAGDWQIFSIPYELEDNLIETVFNEMGPFEYESQWRLMHYDGTQYVDAGAGINKIDLGKGYWFNSVSEVEIKIGKGKVNTAKSFEMSLRQGWNQIGNPYNVPISWNSVRSSNNAESKVESLIQFDADDQSFLDKDIMASFSGGFVWANESTTVDISLADNHTGGRFSSDDIINKDIDTEEWIFDIQLKNNASTYKIASVGMHPEALLTKDKYDKTVLPRFFNYLEMYTSHYDYFYPWFSRDIVPSSSENSWLFELESNYINGLTTLEWNNETLQNAMKQLWLIDEESGYVVNMNDISSYTFDLVDNHSFSIHLSKDVTELPIPFTINLGDPYPNPTNNASTIIVSLPRGQSSYQMELSIFDLKGHKVSTAAAGIFEPGVYMFRTEFDTPDQIKNGVYFYQLKLDNSTKPIYKKLVINK